MNEKRIALVTGANQGIGSQIARDLMRHDFIVLVGSRSLERGEAAAREIGPGAVALQLDVTDQESIEAASARVGQEFGHLNVLINNAAISNTTLQPGESVDDYVKRTVPSNVSMKEMRAVFDTNVFGVVAVTQAMLPLLRKAPFARIINVSTGAASLTRNTDPAHPGRLSFGLTYAASKVALSGVTVAMMVELQDTSIKVNQCSPGHIGTNLNHYAGQGTLEEGAREPVRLALLGPDGPTGTFTRWDNQTIPW